MLTIEIISEYQFHKLIESCDKNGQYHPRGLFLIDDMDSFTAIDNSTGDAWTEEFERKEEAIKWLEGDNTLTPGSTWNREIVRDDDYEEA